MKAGKKHLLWCMIKNIEAQDITSFGGIHLVHEKIRGVGFKSLIDKHLGSRSANAVYSYGDIVLHTCYTVLCGGDCAEDIYKLRSTFEYLQDFKVCSADSILGIQKELSVPTEVLKSAQGNPNEININEKLNSLMVKIATHLNLLSSEVKDYTLDFDHQFLETEKQDARKGYKKTYGYFPGVASINNIPIYLENRNGNCHVSFNQCETLKRVVKTLKDKDIELARFRMDSGSYIKEVTDYITQDLKALFYIRANKCGTLLTMAAKCPGAWKEATIGNQKLELNSFDYQFGQTKHRIVAYRKPNKNGQIDIHTADAKDYLFLLTNDRTWDETAIVSFYNQRGNSERLFDIQNNDFNWNKLPFSKMEHNTVYLHLMAICNMMHRYLLHLFGEQVEGLKKNSRLKQFIFQLICIPAQVVRSAGKVIVKIFGGSRLAKLFVNST